MGEGLTPEIATLLKQTDPCGMECFDEGEGPERLAQQAERRGLVSVSAWRGGWQYELTPKGRTLRSKLTRPTPSKDKADG